MERIRREGYSTLLTPLAGLYDYQQLCKGTIEVKRDYVSLYNHQGFCWYHEGIVEKSASVVVELSVKRIVEVDRQLKKVLGVNGIEHNVVLNLSDEGERWEGDVLDGIPYGWGVLYDSENRLAYEGFRVGEVNVCYGTQYYSDIGVIEYEGEWFEGKRWGRGTHYDRTGVVIYEGGWLNNTHEDERIIRINKDNYRSVLYHTMVEELIVGDDCCNGEEWRMIDFSLLSMLRELRVGDGSFKRVNKVNLVFLHQLERVVIGESCFTEKGDGCIVFAREYLSRFYLKDCEKMRE